MKNFVCKLVGLTFCVNANAAELTIELMDKSNNPVENVIVYVTPTSGVTDLPMNTNKLTIEQRNKKFAPYVTVMQKGQQIEFSNQDDITHHIYSVSGGNRFDFKLKSGAMQKTKVIESAEEIAMGCNIHDWMSGFVLVVDTPYFGKTNTKGKLSLDLAEMGEYQISVWHPQLDVKNNEFGQLHKQMSATQTLSLKLPKNLLPLPKQSGQDDFDFLEEY